jgi:hypothetical protein
MTCYGGFPQSGMRASDADRERTVDVLKAGFAEGRLSKREYDERVGRAYQAGTYGELSALVRDLPQGPMPAQLPAAPAPYGNAPMPLVTPAYLPVPARQTNSLAVGSLLCGLVGTITFVPAIPAIVLGHRARAQIRLTGEGGENAATAGVALGYVGLALWLLAIVMLFAG